MKGYMRVEVVGFVVMLSFLLGGAAGSFFLGTRGSTPVAKLGMPEASGTEALGQENLQRIVDGVGAYVVEAQRTLAFSNAGERVAVEHQALGPLDSQSILDMLTGFDLVQQKLDLLVDANLSNAHGSPEMSEMQKLNSFAGGRLAEVAYADSVLYREQKARFDFENRFRTMASVLAQHGRPDRIGNKKYGGVLFEYRIDYGGGFVETYGFTIKEGLVVGADVSYRASGE